MYAARPQDAEAVRKEARALRLDQHLREWVPPALLRYSRALVRRAKSHAARSPGDR
jgi:hypothetical protein